VTSKEITSSFIKRPHQTENERGNEITVGGDAIRKEYKLLQEQKHAKEKALEY